MSEVKKEAKHYEPSGKTKESLELVNKNFKRAQRYQKPIFDKLLRYYFLYRSIQEETEYPFRNNIFVPVIFSTIETLTPRVVLNQPKIIVMPREKGDDKAVETAKTMIDYRWEQQEIALECIDWFKQNWMYGTSFMKAWWVREKRKIPRKSVIGRLILGKYKTVIDSHPEVGTVDDFNILIDPDCKKVKKAGFIIHQLFKSLDVLQENQEGVYKSLKCVKGQKIKDDWKGKRWRIHDLGNKQRGRIIESGEGGVGEGYSTDNEDYVDIKECYIRSSKKYPLGRLIVTANDRVVIRDTHNPYWYLDGEFPFIEIKDQPVPNELWGIGEVEPIEGLQYERNHIRNRRMDSAEQCMDKMWRVDPDSEVDDNELVWQPNGIIHAKKDEVDVFEAGQPSAAGYNEEDINKQDIQATSGISDFSMGMKAKGLSDTATGILTLVNEANQRFALKIKIIGEMGIKRLVKMLLQMEEYNAEKKRIVRITGKEGFEFKAIKAGEIKSNLDIKVEIDPWPLLNKAYEREQILSVVKLLGKDPGMNQKALKRILLKSYVDNEAEREEILNPPAGQAIEGQPAQEGLKGKLGKLPGTIPLISKGKAPAGAGPPAPVGGKPSPKATLPKNIPMLPK